MCSKKNKREREREVGGGGGVQSMDIIIKYYIVSTGEKNMPYTEYIMLYKKKYVFGVRGERKGCKKSSGH